MKRLLSSLLCISILMISLSSVSLAVHEQSLIITESFEDSWIVDVKGENLPEISDTADKKYYLQNTAYAYHYDAYSQLDTAQKLIYDAVVANPGKLSITINFADGIFDYDNFTQDYFTDVMNALCTDRPDIFYYAGYGIGGGTLHSNGNYVKSLTYNSGVYDESIYTSSNLTSYYNTLMAKVPQVPVDTSNRYKFIKSLHDYLADTVYYPDLNTSDYVMSAHDAYGALIEGRAVCQGYSDAVKLICDYYSIPCVCISGTANGGGHMWNAIQMEDGKWYLMDLTWDDQGSYGTYYDFFLVGTQSTNTYFGGQKFSAEHINDADLALPNLQYATTAYNRNQNMNTLFSGTLDSPYFNENNDFLYFSFLAMLNNDISTKIYYNGMYTGAEASHGVKFQIKDADENVADCTAVIVGDPSGDGQLTRDDYDVATGYVLSSDNRQADDSTAGKCDVNGDGYVDALDLALMHLVESDEIEGVTDF